MTSNGQSSFIIGAPIEELLIESVHESTYDNEATITIDQLRHLVRLVDQSDLAELEVKHGAKKTRLVLRKAKPGEEDAIQPRAEVYPVAQEIAEPVEQTHYTITSSLVGLFQSGSKSKDEPLVVVGDMIKAGQHVGAIQSLHILNEVESAVAGRVVEVFVKDGQPIEYGQPLMTIEL